MMRCLRSGMRALSTATKAHGAYETILHETRGAVALITLNRPKQLNALSPSLVKELVTCAAAYDADPDVGAIVVTGAGEKAFVAGADIKFMASQTYMDMFKGQLFLELDELSAVRKPVIAAVNGFALGGGCELMMLCDFAVAADTAKFGQPEIKLGTIPGLGGTQRFTRAIGKSRAMELCLTGDLIGAEEAAARGLVSRVVPADQLIEDVVATAAKIAGMSQPIVAMAKECVDVAFESSLAEGLRFERRLFYSSFATADQKIGMKAFVDKATPEWEHA